VFSTAAQRTELDADKARFQLHGSPVRLCCDAFG